MLDALESISCNIIAFPEDHHLSREFPKTIQTFHIQPRPKMKSGIFVAKNSSWAFTAGTSGPSRSSQTLQFDFMDLHGFLKRGSNAICGANL